MKKMKSSGIPEAFGVLIFVAVILGIYGYISVNFLKISAEIKTSENQMEVIDSAHILKACLSNDGIISEKRINRMNSMRIECGLPQNVYIEIKNAESGEILHKEGDSNKKYEYKLLVPLLVKEDEINIGEIHVKK